MGKPLSPLAALVALVVLAVIPARPVWAADDQAAARAHEMLRRTQEALRQAQSDNAVLTQAKSDLDARLKEATRQLDATRSGLSAAQGSLHSVQTRQADLQGKFDDASARLATTSTRLSETAKALAALEAELAGTRQKLEQSQAANASCEDKNGKLYTYGQEVLDRYQHKGVWAALRQQEPVFGLKQVEIENVVQEYKLKMAAEKLKSAAH
jgi:chromosome segregation ATPase